MEPSVNIDTCRRDVVLAQSPGKAHTGRHSESRLSVWQISCEIFLDLVLVAVLTPHTFLVRAVELWAQPILLRFAFLDGDMNIVSPSYLCMLTVPLFALAVAGSLAMIAPTRWKLPNTRV